MSESRRLHTYTTSSWAWTISSWTTVVPLMWFAAILTMSCACASPSHSLQPLAQSPPTGCGLPSCAIPVILPFVVVYPNGPSCSGFLLLGIKRSRLTTHGDHLEGTGLLLVLIGEGSGEQVTGYLERAGTKMPGYRVEGTWDGQLHAHLPGKAPRLLWSMPPPNPIPNQCALNSDRNIPEVGAVAVANQ